MNAWGRWAKIARRIRVPVGFLFAIFFLWRARPSLTSLAWSLLLVVPGVVLRAYSSGYIKKNAELTVTGPYAYTRNPLYLGSMLIAFGFAAAARSWLIAGLLLLLFVLIYLPVIRTEEQFLHGAFPGFDAYRQRVPRLLPRFTPARFSDERRAGEGFSGALYRKHREYNAALGTLAIYVFLLLLLFMRHMIFMRAVR